MKKKVIIGIISVLVVISGCLFVMFNSSNKSYEVITNEIEEKIMNTNALTMMYETEAGSGEYQVTSDTTWPQEGYVFNERLSGCENGSKLTWDDENKRVLLQTNTSDKCYVYFDKYTSIEITNVIASNITSDSVTVNVTASGGTNGIARYYYSSNNGSTWVNSTSSSYTFTNLSPGTQYTFRVYVEDTAGYESEQKTVSATTSNPILADVCSSGANLASCIKNYHSANGDGSEGIYLHDGVGSYTNADQEAGDGSYRFSGANPNNYVCFGSTAGTCPNDNLYRIIGVFDNQAKLIKNTSIGNSYWSGSYSNESNTWSSSKLNTETLNETYLNGLGSIWSRKIAITEWQVGGMVYSQTNTVKQYYTLELGSSSSGTTYSAKVGLMYVSDYGYAAVPSFWTTGLYNYREAKSSNYLAGITEWTISRRTDYATYVFDVHHAGGISSYGASYSGRGVRPSFYLNSNVTLTGGNGTQSSPFRIN